MGLNTRLGLVLLVDDSDGDNTFHPIVIEEYGLAEQIRAELTAERALAYLKTRGMTPEAPPPDLIFLDINLPGMDGWEFFKRYHELDAQHHARALVVMLTTSTDPRDHARAEALDLPFFSKPLTHESIDRIVQKLFPEMWR